MKIGSLDLGHKLLLAPMADVTDMPFRHIAKEHGVGLTFTQMVSAKGIITNNFDTLRLLVFSRDEKPIGVQILGNKPSVLYEASKELIRYKPDVIDLNCGCPVSKVVKHNMGADILDNPLLMGELIRSMVKGAEGIPVSVKVRLGRDKKRINIIETAKAAEDNGAAFITIHARTKVARYCEEPEWEWLGRVKEKVSIPVVGNGSVFTPQQALEMQKQTGCDSVMIARGALGNPFLYERYNKLIETGTDPGEPDIDTVAQVWRKHVNMLLKDYSDKHEVIKPVKKNTIWYFKNYPGISSLIDNIFFVSSVDELMDIVLAHCEKIKAEVYTGEDLQTIQNKFEDKVLFWLYDEERRERLVG